MEFMEWFKRLFEKKRISIAVVGIPGSGKSYLLSDMIKSLNNIEGCAHDVLIRNGVNYMSFNRYQANIIASDGAVKQTEMYALRPEEKIYGASTSKFDIDFADIPGEVFSSQQKAGGRTNMDVYADYSRVLRSSKAKNFYVTKWRNPGGIEIVVVEPILYNNRAQTHNGKKAADYPAFNTAGFNKARLDKFQPWESIFGWLKTSDYKEEGRRKKVSGKTIMKNFHKYQPDSLMFSLADKIEDIAPGLNINSTEFEQEFMESFYFLHYCNNATDIVVCDKLLIPQDYNTINNPIDYNTLVTGLSHFIHKNKKLNVYLAFRGVDFMLQSTCSNYKTLCTDLAANHYSEDAIKNIVYSMFAMSVWHKVNPTNTIPQAQLPAYIGLDVNHIPTLLAGIKTGATNIDDIAQMFVDFSCGAGKISIGNGGKDLAALQSIINPHIGSGAANSFRLLLHRAYGFTGAAPGMPMENMPPHVYFTCTPVTYEFDIYENDKESKYQRFRNAQKVGPLEYFDTAGSHFCFGTYQLCLDILAQHGVNVIDVSKIGELLNTSQTT